MERIYLFVFAALVVCVNSVAPPHPSFTEFGELLRDRRKNSTYIPRHLSKGHCWFLSDDECLRDDEALRLAKEERRLVRSGDNIKVLVLLLRFTDHADRELPQKAYFDELFNGASDTDINPIGNIRDYFYDHSLGTYNVTFDVQDWQTTENTEAYYAGGEFGLRGAEAMQEMFKPLLTNLYNSGYDFLPLDSDRWGDLDQLVVLHSGYPAESGPNACTGNPPQNRIWSQGTAVTANGWKSPDLAFSVSSYMLGSAFTGGLCNGVPQKHGLIVHEYTHGFGAIDLYDQDRDEPAIKLGGVAKFGMMSNLFGWKRNEKIPGMMNPFTRVMIGWLTPIFITEDGYYPIQPCELSTQIYVIRKNFPSGEYIYLENRQPYRWDADWDASGIVMYKIDENADKQFTRGYPGHPNWPADHYEVSVLQADGKYDLEQGNDVGEEGDFWSFGQKLSPGGNFPNSDAISFGNRRRTGIEIEVVSDTKFIVLVRISGLS